MKEGIPPQTVIQGLKTTSDKIRALARAGYARAEISKFLDIRYQHVRKVLLDAGITDGLRRNVQFERPPVATEVAPTPKAPTKGDELLGGGFQLLGEWVKDENGCKLTAKAPTEVGVYAFLVEDIVVYVGLAQRGLRVRMGHYRRGHHRQRISARVKSLIVAALASDKRVKVLIASPRANCEWNGLPINAAAGLEAGLIRMIQPEWNIIGKSK
jgi:hypothetical protein